MIETLAIEMLDSQGMASCLQQLAQSIIEEHLDLPRTVLIGIRTRGVPLAQRLAKCVLDLTHSELGVGALDITFFRDDLQQSGLRTPDSTDMPRDLTGYYVVLVDDVIFRGRTVRAALEALQHFGRPQQIRLAVLVDRGHRELPIQPDYVGFKVPSQLTDVVKVHVQEQDGEDRVFLQQTA